MIGLYIDVVHMSYIVIEGLGLTRVDCLSEYVTSNCNLLTGPNYLDIMRIFRHILNPEIYFMLLMSAIGELEDYLRE